MHRGSAFAAAEDELATFVGAGDATDEKPDVVCLADEALLRGPTALDVALTEAGPVEAAWFVEDTDPVAEVAVPPPTPPLAPLCVAK